MRLSYVPPWVVFAFGSPAMGFISGREMHSVNRASRVDMSVPNALDTFTSGLSSICRLPYGVTVSDDALSSTEQPRLVKLYDVENDEQCRAVRERITELDLVVGCVIPAAPNSRVFQDETYEHALSVSTEATIPRLVVVEDSGEEEVVVGAPDILFYLNKKCANGSAASSEDSGELQDTVLAAINPATKVLAGLLRAGRGKTVASAAQTKGSKLVPRPSKPLILYSYEGNQFCRLVREVLTELDLPYELRSVGKMSPRREELAEVSGGSTQCPFLIDPNTGTKMPESADIVLFLYKNYALWTPPNELLQFASNSVIPLFKPLFEALTPLQAGSNQDDKAAYGGGIARAKAEIDAEVAQNQVVIYTYSLSPFSKEAKALLDNLGISYKEISLGMEWLPGLLSDPQKRAALLEMTGQSSLPHVFIGGKSIGGLFSGTPGLVPALEEGSLQPLVETATSVPSGAFE